MKCVLLFGLTACLWAGDAQRGAAVVQEQSCLECHTVNAQGIGHEANATAPDLGVPSKSAFTPSALASALWNHTPAMRREVSAKSVTRPELSEAAWGDVFAYLYSEQIFQFPAETRRGLEAFDSKGCSDCHSPTKSSPGQPRSAPAVSTWKSGEDPATLVGQMWNHASTMKEEFAGRNRSWPTLDGRDFGDIAAYVQYVQKLAPQSWLTLPEASSGKAAFARNCEQCHQGPLALETRLANKTFLDIGAGVWNHVPLMGPFPTVSDTDMRKILAYVWDLQYQGPKGNVTLGELAFSSKGCGTCHIDARTGHVVNLRPGKVFTPFSMAAIAWGSNHRMQREIRNEGETWPTLSPNDISDLVAYLNYVSRK